MAPRRWHRAAACEDARADPRSAALVRDVCHQLATPISIARSLADAIRAADGSGMRCRDLDDLVAELDRLAHIARGLMLCMDDRRETLIRAPVDLEDVVVATARRCSRMADRDWAVNVRADGTLHADRPRLAAALDAIVENAVAFTGAGDRIAITARAVGDVAVLEVADSGIGIAQSALPRIFDRFYSDHRGQQDKRGSGLGLPIAKAIVEAHGGTVAVRSREGQGTTIALRIPGFAPGVALAA